MRQISFVMLAIVAAAFLPACGRSEGTESEEKAEMEKVAISDSEWSILQSRRVVFAHQSVGQNILDGAAALAVERGAVIDVVELEEPESAASFSPGIYHFFVGENGDPMRKLRHFRDSLGAMNLHTVDVAMVKLCYIDFGEDMDVVRLAREYIETLTELQEKHGETKFVAVTAPLTTTQSGLRAWVKRLLGREPYGVIENSNRHAFNEILRAHFQESALFDIAQLESGDSSPVSLRPQLTTDGGHLNEHGARLAGAAFLKFLATTDRR